MKTLIATDDPDGGAREIVLRRLAAALRRAGRFGRRRVDTTTADKSAARELGRLAQFILDEVPGEPSRSEGAVDTAIRLISQAGRAES